MLDSNSETLRRVLKADLHLASFDSSCWSAQVSNAFNVSRPIVGSDESCDRAVKLVGS